MTYEVIPDADPWKEFEPDAIEKAAELEILPKLPLSEVTESGPIQVSFISEPRKVRSAKLPQGMAWFVDVEWNDMKASMVLPRSLLFSVLTLAKRYKWQNWTGRTVSIVAGRGLIKTPTFEGEAKTYRATPV